MIHLEIHISKFIKFLRSHNRSIISKNNLHSILNKKNLESFFLHNFFLFAFFSQAYSKTTNPQRKILLYFNSNHKPKSRLKLTLCIIEPRSRLFHTILCKSERETPQEGVRQCIRRRFPAALIATGTAMERRVIKLINWIAYTCTRAGDTSVHDVDSWRSTGTSKGRPRR